MAYDLLIAQRIRAYLSSFPELAISERKMFGGLAFLIENKMCVNVSGNRLMCRFDPKYQNEVASKTGFQPMMMKGKLIEGYCYVHEEGFHANNDLEYWLKMCLSYNAIAKAARKPYNKG